MYNRPEPLSVQKVEKTIGQFVSALRKADLEVSPAETLDAMAALDLIGLKDKQLLQDSLSIILAKTPAEKETQAQAQQAEQAEVRDRRDRKGNKWARGQDSYRSRARVESESRERNWERNENKERR